MSVALEATCGHCWMACILVDLYADSILLICVPYEHGFVAKNHMSTRVQSS